MVKVNPDISCRFRRSIGTNGRKWAQIGMDEKARAEKATKAYMTSM